MSAMGQKLTPASKPDETSFTLAVTAVLPL
jgi:hypothetical protein